MSEPMPHDADAFVANDAAADPTERPAVAPTERPGADVAHPEGWLPSQPPRRPFESVFVRVVATLGVIGIGTLLGALLVANDVSGWIVGLTVSLVSVVLAAVLWRTRQL